MNDNDRFPDVIELNVGGKHFTTTLLTLTKSKDTMLAAMFSGNYSATKDKDGRYFIDADGENFVYILNYLRYGELPPASMASTVYREAAYFGLSGLVEQLERFPSLLARIHRDSYRQQFPGFQKLVNSVLDIVTDSSTKNKGTSSDIIIVLFSKEKKPKLPNYEINHTCSHRSMSSWNVSPDVCLGPWGNKTTEKEVMNCIAHDFKEKGFVITHDSMGQCNYKCDKVLEFPGDEPFVENCCKLFFRLTFHWWKM